LIDEVPFGVISSGLRCRTGDLDSIGGTSWSHGVMAYARTSGTVLWYHSAIAVFRTQENIKAKPEALLAPEHTFDRVLRLIQ
jgi:hypothetical protein